MAIFHLSAKVISRGKGQSAIAAAAYRSGDRLRDEQTNEEKFYHARAERIGFTDIMSPKDAPEWARERNSLWNQAERAEKRKDAQLAREIEVSLPHELTEQQREWLVKDFAREAFVRRGYAVDIAIHAPDKDSDSRNHHAHLMVSMRAIGPDGFAKTKDRNLNSEAQLGAWREQWAHLTNRHLERHGHAARVDHRSLKEQGIEREPMIHLGYAANEMGARGAPSDRVEELLGIQNRNQIRIDVKALEREVKGLENERDAAAKQAAQAREQKTAAQGERPHVAIEIDHALADAQAKAARERAAMTPEQRQAEKDANANARQAAWREDVSEQVAARERVNPVEKGLQVIDGATGAMSGLADYVVDLLAGQTPREPERESVADFLNNPQSHREQQLGRVAAMEAGERDAQAMERIAEDMQAGKALRAEDVANLSRARQEQIAHFGDDAMRQMVEDLHRRNENYWNREGQSASAWSGNVLRADWGNESRERWERGEERWEGFGRSRERDRD